MKISKLSKCQTSEYGDGKSYNARGLSLEGLHWVYNNRIQAMVKFTF